MNRIQLTASPGDSPPQSTMQVEQSLLKISSRPGLPHALFVPLHYERNYAYPLLVWLHGPGDDERQLQRVLPLISMRNYVGVAPRGHNPRLDPRDSGQHPAGPLLAGFRWLQTEDAIALAEQCVFDCIALAKDQMNIAPQRIYVAGYGCGGTMAFRIALRHPGHFAGALSVGGPFPTGNMPLLQLEQLRRLPLFIAHGRDAAKYPVERTCEELRLFHAAGLSATLRQYPCGDELTTQMLHDMDVWIMERVTGISQTPDLDAPPPGQVN